MRAFSSGVLILVLFSLAAVAQDRPLVEDLGVSTTEKAPDVVFPDAPLPVEQWGGEEFIFLPKPKELQKTKYSSCRREGQSQFEWLGYGEAVGRIGVVEKVHKDLRKTTLQLRMKDNGEVITCSTYSAEGKQPWFQGLALVKDIVLARESWEGKTYYTNQRQFTTYDSTAGEYGDLNVRRFVPVKVVKVSASEDVFECVRVVVETKEGKQGYFTVSFSGTNRLSGNQLPFSFYLLEKDPHTQYKWSKKVWKAIEGGHVFIGMTEAQMKMAMPSPLSVTTSVSKKGAVATWRFPDYTVTLIRGKVATITTHTD